jgi:DNA polymerase I-like protein with 3'-5' exonuclease and polymerase domains
MIDIDSYIKENNLESKIKILLQIHDELIIEVDESCVDQEKNILKDILADVLEKRLNDKKWKELFIPDTAIEEVPIKSDLKIGDNLYELK